MPRYVDHDARRRAIVDAALRILAEGGPAEVTIRGVARRLGGSITVVTHYFPTRPELMREVVAEALRAFDVELAEIEEGADDRARLRLLLRWMLPLTDADWMAERGRILLLAQNGADSGVEEFSDVMDARMRDLLRRHVEPLVPGDRVGLLVDLLRIITNGIVLSAVEHRADWSASRQLAVLDDALASLGL